jgi:CHASE1-domain containing sensor protein
MPPRITKREWLPLVILIALALLGLALVPVIFPAPVSQ